jgi:regulatory protein
MADERREAIERATRALARRDHSAASLRLKLGRAGISAAAQDEALGALARAGYLDDARFARERAAQLAARGYGDERIRADLASQGVSAAAVELALAGLDSEEERAEREAARLGGGPRAARALARRGFAEESLERLVAQDADPGVG